MTPAAGGRALVRRLAIGIAATLLTLLLVFGGLLGLYLSRPESGPGHDFLDAIQAPIRQNEELQYNVHRALGKLFSLCECTAGLSVDQYRRASFHRPKTEEARP
jgi:hypothetical protein